MIPAYNCLAFLGYTIESVLVQDPGAHLMQIEVVDDHSTDGDVAALVERIGRGRVLFFRQEKNRGSLRNFETCLNRSRGRFVHILHGDDMVKPGFYHEIEQLFQSSPEAGAAFTDSVFINEQGVESKPFDSRLPQQCGVIENFMEMIAQSQYVQTPAMVVKRSVYEQLGGFFAVHYGEDWEMWIRVAAHYPVAYSPRKLAVYRGGHASSITGGWILSGQNVKDIARVIDIAQAYLPADRKKRLGRSARRNFSIAYAGASNRIYHIRRRSAFIQAREALKLSVNIRSVYWVSRLVLLHVGHLLHINRSK